MVDEHLEEAERLDNGTPLYVITYQSGGLNVKAYLAKPKGRGPFRTVVYCRGGIGNWGLPRKEWISEWVNLGCLVLAPLYRGNLEGEGREDFAGEDREDVIQALDWLKDYSLADAKRIHLFGFSRGACMAIFAAIQMKEAIVSVTVWGGVSDMALTYEERVDLRRMLKRVIGVTPYKNKQPYLERSPLHYIASLNVPLMIIHGDMDEQVSVRHAILLVHALKQADKAHKLYIQQGEGHLVNKKKRIETFCMMLDWMKQNEKQ